MPSCVTLEIIIEQYGPSPKKEDYVHALRGVSAVNTVYMTNMREDVVKFAFETLAALGLRLLPSRLVVADRLLPLASASIVEWNYTGIPLPHPVPRPFTFVTEVLLDYESVSVRHIEAMHEYFPNAAIDCYQLRLIRKVDFSRALAANFRCATTIEIRRPEKRWVQRQLPAICAHTSYIELQPYDSDTDDEVQRILGAIPSDTGITLWRFQSEHERLPEYPMVRALVDKGRAFRISVRVSSMDIEHRQKVLVSDDDPCWQKLEQEAAAGCRIVAIDRLSYTVDWGGEGRPVSATELARFCQVAPPRAIKNPVKYPRPMVCFGAFGVGNYEDSDNDEEDDGGDGGNN
jgi:hypothetical protein